MIWWLLVLPVGLLVISYWGLKNIYARCEKSG